MFVHESTRWESESKQRVKQSTGETQDNTRQHNTTQNKTKQKKGENKGERWGGKIRREAEKNRAHTIRAAGVIFFFAIAWAVQMGLSDSGSSGSLAVAGQVHGNVDGARSGRTLLQEEETGNEEGEVRGPRKHA